MNCSANCPLLHKDAISRSPEDCKDGFVCGLLEALRLTHETMNLMGVSLPGLPVSRSPSSVASVRVAVLAS